MSLFQKSVVEKYLNAQNKQTVSDKWKLYQSHFLNPTIQENIRNSKEEQYQGEFLIDLFVNVLGYTKNPTPNFNLTTEIKNEKDSKKADGGIIVNETVVGVIELKGTNTTDLNKIEVQAFGYKNNQKDCVYVITSNFEKLRFYIDNAIENVEFNLFQLTEKEFALLYLCLAFENISKNIPKKIKEESVNQENQITKSLYKDYSVFKNALFHNLTDLNPEFEPLELFKKSQKLIDRFLFLFFGEDRQLLPPNSVRLILDDWKDLQERDEDIPLYNRYKKYFEYLNTGFKGKRYDVFAYNGGLFKPDAILDNIKIDNQLLYDHTIKLAKYDFASEVDVNILGHIFENSLNELDEMKAKLDDPMGLNPLKTLSKRKKDGVFYTPKYITKYIVVNTVGKLCTEKKAALQFNEEDYTADKKRTKATKQPLVDKLTQYRNWLLQITIIDPACGSGAFLNEALNFLIAEHSYIDELQAKLFGDALVLSDVEKSILENNLFGVDLNEESVEIAKLSLWLRTAQPNRKLNDLNNNIKCGNSLIDDPEIAGDKAFNWHNEFPQIFKEKNKKAYHLVFTTHNSRVSQRMIDYNVQKGPALNLDLEQEIGLTQIFKEIILENNYNCLAYNICKDHVHLILVCEEEALSDFAKVLKGKSSYLYQSKGFKPIGTPLWSQKFFFAQLDELIWSDIAIKPGYIATDDYLNNAIAYIKTNRNKHNLSDSKELKSIINDFTKDIDIAFETEYKGGFDVVIGNPPYVRVQSLKEFYYDQTIFLEKKFLSATGKYDLYALFMEKSYELINESGIVSFILPHKFLVADFGIGIRDFFVKTKSVESIVHFGSKIVFNDASTYTCIINLKKANNNIKYAEIDPNNLFNDFNFELINYDDLNNTPWILKNGYGKSILDKIKNEIKLIDICEGIYQGLITTGDDIFMLDGIIKNNLFYGFSKELNEDVILESSILKEVLKGQDIKRYLPLKSNKYVIYPHKTDIKNKTIPLKPEEFLSNFPLTHKYLSNFQSALTEKKIRYKTNPLYWYSLHRAREITLFEKDYIITPQLQNIPSFTKKESDVYADAGGYLVLLKKEYSSNLILPILNSKLLWYFIKNTSSEYGGGYFYFKTKYLEPFGIPISKLKDYDFEKITEFQLNATKQFFLLIEKFQRTIQRKFDLQDLPKKLQDWYQLSYSEFIKELSKKKVKLSLSDEAEWEDYFVQESAKAILLKAEIDATDKAIDKIVYDLYGLNEEEIEIVENS